MTNDGGVGPSHGTGGTGGPRYSIVAPVYRVEKYLDAFFESIVGQTIGFEACLQLVVVDDGSDDGSPAICERWARRFPGNIVLVRRANGGALEAVRQGLGHARGEWVAMFGADDHIDPDYFAHVDRALAAHADARPSMINCRQVLHFERGDERSDTHPLHGRFAHGVRLARLDEGRRPEFQLSAASALFRRSEVLKVGDVEDVRPNFEDANFIARYLLGQPSPTALVVPDAVYYYRKRADGSSLLDAAPRDPRRYSSLLERGYLRLLVDAHRIKGEVPRWLQRLVLYDLTWQFKAFFDNPEAADLVPRPMRPRYHALLERIFAYIDRSTILDFEFPGMSMLGKLGIIERYRRESAPAPWIELVGLDARRGLIQFRAPFAGALDAGIAFRDGDALVEPVHRKTRVHEFVGEPFGRETLYWLRWHGRSTYSATGPRGAVKLRGIEPDAKLDRLTIGAPEAVRSAPLQSGVPRAPKALIVRAEEAERRRVYDDAWLLIDQRDAADDNAEHLYRHLMRDGTPVNAFFVLDPRSPDWSRLSDEGFRLLPLGSTEHRIAALLATNIVASHSNEYSPTPFPLSRVHGLARHAFTFLGHGVIANEGFVYFNRRPMDRIVCANPREAAFLAADRNRYRYCGREPVVTGLPRHDALLALRDTPPDRILLMPTWRRSLAGMDAAGFAGSEYCRRWRAILEEPGLHAAARARGFGITLLLHPRMRAFASQFDVPGVETVTRPEGSIQQLMARSALFVTDYSSVAFDMAYIERPIAYYQFDEDEFFDGSHTLGRGHFDFRSDGFGPVCTTQDELLGEVRRLLSTGSAERAYAQRMRDFFPHRDGRCCERVVRAIRENA